MTHSPQSPLMPDFLDALEADLRERSAAAVLAPEAAPRRSPRTRRRWVLGAAGGLATTGAVVVGLSITLGAGTAPAYGKLRILSTPKVAVPAGMQQGMMLQMALGSDARLVEAHAVPAFGGTAYIARGPQGWCLSAPDPASDQPDLERGATCTPTATVENFGISLTLTSPHGTQAIGHYIAAVPHGAEPPTLKTADGTRRSLTPNDVGVVVVDGLNDGDSVTLHGLDGQRRTDAIQASPTEGQRAQRGRGEGRPSVEGTLPRTDARGAGRR